MSKRRKDVSTLRGAWRSVRKQQWRIMGSGMILGILAVLCLGYLTRQPFLRDFAANLAADAVVAIAAFYVINMAFGLRERQQRETEARQKANSLLEGELLANLGNLQMILELVLFERPLLSPIPPLLSETWTLLVQGPLVAQLDADLLWSLHSSYTLSKQALDAVRQFPGSRIGEPLHNVPAALVSDLEAAKERTGTTLVRLMGEALDLADSQPLEALGGRT